MSVRINTNIEALNAQRHISATATAFAKSVERLSSGLRINRAADDAAGLAISEKLKAQVTGLNQAQRNSQDGISMVQTAEGALTEVHSMLQRVRELAVQASNSTLSASDAASVSDEVTSLRAEINRISGATTFNGQHLLTGSLSTAQDTAAAGSLVTGTQLNSGHNATVTAVDVSGANPSTTYTLTAQGDKVTLSDGTVSQQVSLAATIGAAGTETIDFANMGVKINVAGSAAKTAAELATDLAAAGGTVAVVDNSDPATNLTSGEVLAGPRGGSSDPDQTISYANEGLGGLESFRPLQASAPGGPVGTLTLSVDANTGVITGTLGGRTFTGSLPNPGANWGAARILNDGYGNRINLYAAVIGADWTNLAADLNGVTFTIPPSATSTATVSNLVAAPGATPGTYLFGPSIVGASFVSVTGPGGFQTIAALQLNAPNDSHTFDFGAFSFTATAGASAFFDGQAALTTPGNNKVVITAGAGGAANNVIATGAGSAANFQVGANAGDSLAVNFADARTTAAGYGSLDSAITAFASATGSGTGIVAAAKALITATDTAIDYISTTRGKYGAVQNRLEHTIASVSVAAENLNASMSRIKDLDVAAEMVNFTKTQILQQAGLAILAQANSGPQGILALLR